MFHNNDETQKATNPGNHSSYKPPPSLRSKPDTPIHTSSQPAPPYPLSKLNKSPHLVQPQNPLHHTTSHTQSPPHLRNSHVKQNAPSVSSPLTINLRQSSRVVRTVPKSDKYPPPPRRFRTDGLFLINWPHTTQGVFCVVIRLFLQLKSAMFSPASGSRFPADMQLLCRGGACER